jgi:splicing factor 45
VLSALNAVNRFDEGWEFRGRKIRAKYYDERKFHAGIYDH